MTDMFLAVNEFLANNGVTLLYGVATAVGSVWGARAVAEREASKYKPQITGLESKVNTLESLNATLLSTVTTLGKQNTTQQSQINENHSLAEKRYEESQTQRKAKHDCLNRLNHAHLEIAARDFELGGYRKLTGGRRPTDDFPEVYVEPAYSSAKTNQP